MSTVDISYKDEVIASLNTSGKKTLLTSGKYCEDNIEIEYTAPTPTYTATISGTGSGSLYVRYKNTTYNSGSFSFSKDDELYIYVSFNYGPVSIVIDGVTVRSGQEQGISYTYTLPGRDIDIEFTVDNINGYSAEIDSGIETPTLITKSITSNGTYSAENDNADGYSSVTVNVSGGGGSSEVSDAVRFIDYDGTILHEYSKSEFLALTSMPANPSHTGLTAQGWNWSLSDAKTHVTSWDYLDIGQMYVTTSGATEIDIEIPTGFKRLSPWITLGVNGEVSIDWGDNSTPDSVTGTNVNTYINTNHTYSNTGNYTIKISLVTGSYTMLGSSGKQFFNGNASTNTQNAVYSSLVKSVRMGSGINSMPSYTFGSLYNLSSVTIPSSVTSISSYSFQNCYSLSSVTIPSGVTVISLYTFYNCYSLSSVAIPSSVTSVNNSVFQYCYSLSSVTVPSGVTSIGSGALLNCYHLFRRVLPLYNIKINSLCLSVTNANTNGVSNLATLEHFTIQSGVTSIETSAFKDCYSLSSVTIPSSVTSIGDSVFHNCYSLSSATIPSGITSIGSYTFCSCYSLSSVTIPSSVTSIGGNAFQYCYSLSSVTIPSGATSIGSNAFQGCYSLSSVTIPSGVTSISSSAFYNCYSLSSVTIPSSVTNIYASAFYNCYGVKEYHILAETPPTLANKNAFNNIPSDCIIYVPSASVDDYKAASNWSNYASKIQGE